MGHLKKLLFLTTALTFWSSSVSAQTPNTPENGEPGQVIGFTDQTYSINDGFYQGGNGGITISQINSNTVLNFNGTDNAGKIWDFASYLEGELGEGETVDPIKVDGTKVTPSYVEGGYFGNLTIDNGTFNDSANNGIQIYKGFSADTVVVSKDGKGTPQSFVSSGDLIINYGTFNFSKKNGEERRRYFPKIRRSANTTCYRQKAVKYFKLQYIRNFRKHKRYKAEKEEVDNISIYYRDIMTVAVVAGCVELWKYRTCVPECASNTYVSLISECSDTKNPVDNHVEILWTTPKLCTMLWKTFPCFMCEIAGASKMKKNEILFTGACKGLRIMRDYGIII